MNTMLLLHIFRIGRFSVSHSRISKYAKQPIQISEHLINASYSIFVQHIYSIIAFDISGNWQIHRKGLDLTALTTKTLAKYCTNTGEKWPQVAGSNCSLNRREFRGKVKRIYLKGI